MPVLGTVEEEEEVDLVEETELVKDGVLVLGTVSSERRRSSSCQYSQLM